MNTTSKAFVFDLDNTLLPWTEAYLAGMTALVEGIVNLVQPVDELHAAQIRTDCYAQLKDWLTQNNHQYEHPHHIILNIVIYFIRKNPTLQKRITNATEGELEALYTSAFESTIKNPYEGMREAIQEIHRRGHKIAIYSNAPFDRVVHRLRAANLGHLLTLIAAWNNEHAQDGAVEASVQQVRNWKGTFVLFKKEDLKPNLKTPRILADILETPLEHLYFIGDVPHDIDIPAQLGAPTIHATEYNRPAPEAITLLQTLGIWHPRTLPQTQHPTITHPRDLLKHL